MNQMSIKVFACSDEHQSREMTQQKKMYYAKGWQPTALSLWTKWRRRFRMPLLWQMVTCWTCSVLWFARWRCNWQPARLWKWKTSGHSRFRYAAQVRKPRRNSSANNITAAHIQFRPGKMVKVATRSEALSFTKVTGKKESIVDDPTDPSEPSNPGDSGNGEAPDPAA